VLNPVAGTVSYLRINLIVYVLNIFFECVYPVAFHATQCSRPSTEDELYSAVTIFAPHS